MKLESVRRHYQRFGARSLLHALTHRALNRFIDYQAISAMVLRRDGLRATDLLTCELDYTTRFLSSEELLEFARRGEGQLGWDFLDDALARGDRCYGILDGERLAAYGWYSTQATRAFDDLWVRFSPGWVYMYKGFTHPEYRGQRLHGIGMARALAALTSEGYRGLVSWVATDNAASLKSCERLGYEIFGTVRVAEVAGRRRIRATRSCREYAFALVPGHEIVRDKAGRHAKVLDRAA